MARRPKTIEVDPILYTFKEMILLSVQSASEDILEEQRDLNQRQLAVFLIVCLEDGQHTVRGLAARMQVTKPAITRALDRLEGYELVRRNEDPKDRRSIFVTQTDRGTEYLKELSSFAVQAKMQRQRRRPARGDDDE